MTSGLLFDITRTCMQPFNGMPTGIDRVEFSYGYRFFVEGLEHPSTSIVTTPIAVGAVRSSVAKSHFEGIRRAWQGALDTPDIVRFVDRIRAAVEARETAAPARPARFQYPSRRSLLSGAMKTPLRELPLARARLRAKLASVKGPRVYFHASHWQLPFDRRFRWLGRANVPAVFFVHDAIPLEYPEFVEPGSAALHHARLQTVANEATLVIVNSETTKRSITNYILGQGWRLPEIEIVPLGGDGLASASESTRFRLPDTPYFVCIGTIEARKNLVFLLNLWRELARRHGIDTPKLVLVGRRGWENGNVFAMLERSRELAAHVVEINDLPDSALGALVRGSRSVLAPSQAEGFSLPVAEGLSLGAPVIASDITAHREVGGDFAIRIDPTDGPAWLGAIEKMAFDDAFRSAQRARGAGYRSLTWSGHVDRIIDVLGRVARENVRGGDRAVTPADLLDPDFAPGAAP